MSLTLNLEKLFFQEAFGGIFWWAKSYKKLTRSAVKIVMMIYGK